MGGICSTRRVKKNTGVRRENRREGALEMTELLGSYRGRVWSGLIWLRRDKWKAVVSTLMCIRITQSAANFLTSLYQFTHRRNFEAPPAAGFAPAIRFNSFNKCTSGIRGLEVGKHPG
jgi:hypothetical protein